MTVADQIRILDRKIKQNEAQYVLDRKAAKISALSSGNLDKCEYLTGEDLDCEPSTAEQTKCDYFPLSNFFHKRFKEKHKKEALLKRLKNIEDKSEEQLKTINDEGEIQTKIISKNKIKPPPLKSIHSQEAKDGRIDNNEAEKIFKTLEDMEGSKTDYSKLVYRSGDNDCFNFHEFVPLPSFYLKFINGVIGINVARLDM